MEFHIARVLRDRYDLKDLLFAYTGNVVFANVAASRRLAQSMNEARVAAGGAAAAKDPTALVHAGALFAMGLIDELSHAVIARYREQQDPALLKDALQWFSGRVGAKGLDALLLAFTERFPNVAVYNGKLTAKQWLAGQSEGMTHREAALEELLLLWLANANPAYTLFKALFDDATLRTGQPAYAEFAADADAYFETRPEFDAESKTLLQALRAPMVASPDSLSGQLDFIRKNWADVLGADLARTLLAIDVLREEEIAIWMQFNPAGKGLRHHGRGLEADGGAAGFQGDEYVGYDEFYEDVMGPDGHMVRRRRQYSSDYQAPLVEYEAFSHDDAWMPTVVLMAKSTYVWLEQLSKKYQRHIYRLDQIPVEELQLLADRGMTGLWLIGLWERSRASQTIKRLRGQYDAVASAYSLMDYRIADDLGGNEAYERLRDLAGTVGLRLASDMVPNHMGIDSNWVIEHPEWFVRRHESPFPVYTFEGPDLSTDARVEIKIEDHYYDQTDAAVAYRMRYRDGGGRTEYVYHGNDGTTFAWNDTAQLDYSQAAVREQVIQVILSVARQFPIIRFDAAMVLAKRHVQRLWFPLPGVGGSIPSRAENAMTQDEFDRIMPNEFWREVVDRVAQEVPGTLLLAEAFWLLEGYFVRTLGMHRVYNSAFMVMLRDEENAKYRSYLKKTIEFDPDIMKRYVNFMSNPDERTTIDQFGSGDKCFGVATMLATLPGLPMFGHGQIEGFNEKYGMEFKQAKQDEWPNEGLVSRHQAEIAPLLKDRALFAESEHFVLYDYWTGDGRVNENVFAYSNRLGDRRALILYNNAYDSTHGTVHISAASMDKWTGEMRQRSVADALNLPRDGNTFLAYRDTARGLEFLRRASEVNERGITVDLRGYQYAVLLHWRELRTSAEHPWAQLHDALHGGGVADLDEALTRVRLRPLTDALRYATNSEAMKLVVEGATATWAERTIAVAERLRELDGATCETAQYRERVSALAAATALLVAKRKTLPPHTHAEALWLPLLAWVALSALPANAETIDRLQLRSSLAEIFAETGLQGEDAWRAVARVRLSLQSYALTAAALWAESDVQWLIGVNEHEGVRYLNSESLLQLVQWLSLTGAEGKPVTSAAAKLATDSAATAGYRFDDFVALMTAPVVKKTVVAKPVPVEPAVTKQVASNLQVKAIDASAAIDTATVPDVFAPKVAARKSAKVTKKAKPKTPPL